jgi:hypothetical protein
VNTTRCETCGVEYAIGAWPFCPHGLTTHYGIQTDEAWIGGRTFENMASTPLTFYSRREWKRKMKELGIRNEPRHVGTAEGDRNRHTQRWL